MEVYSDEYDIDENWNGLKRGILYNVFFRNKLFLIDRFFMQLNINMNKI